MRNIPYHHEPGKLPPTLTRIPFFKQVDEHCLDESLHHSSLAEYDVGEIIVEEGSKAQEFFILLKGTVQVTRSGKQVALVENAGEMLGELAVLNKAARTASVVACNKVFCLKVDQGFIGKLSEIEQSAYYIVLYRFLVEVLTNRLAETSQRVAELEKEIAR